MKLLMENWREYLTEDRSIEEKLGRLFWDHAESGIQMAQNAGYNEVANGMAEVRDEVKPIFLNIRDWPPEEWLAADQVSESDVREMVDDTIKPNILTIDHEATQVYQNEYWWNEEKHRELITMLFRASEFPKIRTSTKNIHQAVVKGTTDAYEWIENWLKVGGSVK